MKGKKARMCNSAAFSRSFSPVSRIGKNDTAEKNFPAAVVIIVHVRSHVCNGCADCEYRLTNIARIKQNETWFFGFLNYIISVVTNFFYKGERKIKLFSYLDKYKVFYFIVEYLYLNISKYFIYKILYCFQY